jgi:hypothetical protein
MKPDLFVAYHALVEEKEPYDNAPQCTEERLFGKFPCWNCRMKARDSGRGLCLGGMHRDGWRKRRCQCGNLRGGIR